jgi:hypothetical protein
MTKVLTEKFTTLEKFDALNLPTKSYQRTPFGVVNTERMS